MSMSWGRCGRNVLDDGQLTDVVPTPQLVPSRSTCQRVSDLPLHRAEVSKRTCSCSGKERLAGRLAASSLKSQCIPVGNYAVLQGGERLSDISLVRRLTSRGLLAWADTFVRLVKPAVKAADVPISPERLISSQLVHEDREVRHRAHERFSRSDRIEAWWARRRCHRTRALSSHRK